jgi:hypothetical protein
MFGLLGTRIDGLSRPPARPIPPRRRCMGLMRLPRHSRLGAKPEMIAASALSRKSLSSDASCWEVGRSALKAHVGDVERRRELDRCKPGTPPWGDGLNTDPNVAPSGNRSSGTRAHPGASIARIGLGDSDDAGAGRSVPMAIPPLTLSPAFMGLAWGSAQGVRAIRAAGHRPPAATTLSAVRSL